MAKARKHYSRYYIVRGDQTLWKGDPRRRVHNSASS